MPDFAMRLGLDKALPGERKNLNLKEDNLKVLWANFKFGSFAKSSGREY
jgi:hypothetical protein